ncbi:hypothetical protein ABEB36_004665 [Hypothenemus hampei]|uniref:Uncharacterized protein n=1 Tax=Hypothenemus hampei TaxID=57062 RepID=A0ABD1F422_HYPHA
MERNRKNDDEHVNFILTQCYGCHRYTDLLFAWDIDTKKVHILNRRVTQHKIDL